MLVSMLSVGGQHEMGSDDSYSCSEGEEGSSSGEAKRRERSKRNPSKVRVWV